MERRERRILAGAGHPGPLPDEPAEGATDAPSVPEMGAGLLPWSGRDRSWDCPGPSRASALIAGALTVLAFAPFDLFWLPP